MVGDAIKRIPGVNTSGSDRAFGQTFNIRGIGAPEAAGEEGRIIVNVDGANKYYEQYRMGGFFSDPELYKKIEVLRGPASSTLYGSGALGGVVNFVTKDAEDFLVDGRTGVIKLKGSYNSNRNGYLGSIIYAQRVNEYVDILASGNYRTSDNYVTGNGTQINSSDFEAWSGLAKVTVSDGYEGKLRLSYQHWDSDANDQGYGQAGTASYLGTVDRHVIDRTAVISYENPFSDNRWLDLKVSASFSDTTNEQTDASYGAYCSVSGYEMFCDTDFGYRTWQFKAQNTIDYIGSGFENYLTFGYQFALQERSAEIKQSASVSAFGFHPEGTDTKHGFYIQDELVVDERFTLIPGVRWEWRTLSPGGSNTSAVEVDDYALSPKIAAHYRFNDNFAIFGSFAHTERFPTLDEVYSTTGNGTVFLPSYDLKKEESDNIEVGFAISAYDLREPGDSFQLKTTAFQNVIENLIDNNPAISAATNPNPYPGYINIDNAEIYGVEVEMAYDSQYWFASAGYSYSVGRNTDTGLHLTSVAPHELALTLGGRLPDQGLEFGWKSRFVSDPQDDCRRSSSSVVCTGDSSSGSTRYAEAFDVHDVFVTWLPRYGEFKGWEARFGVENVFDTQYKEFLHNDAARGRTFKFSLAKALGW